MMILCVLISAPLDLILKLDEIPCWALLHVTPPPAPVGQLQGHHPGTAVHQRLAPSILERLLVAEQGRLPVSPCI